jgi:hypothetical protein
MGMAAFKVYTFLQILYELYTLTKWMFHLEM